MNWYGGGLIIIINYVAGTSTPEIENNFLLLDNSDFLLLDGSNLLLL